MPRFAVLGLDHRHVYDLTAGLLAAGASCVGYDPVTSDPRVLAGFQKRFPEVPALERRALLDDPRTDFVVIAAIPCDRAALAIEAMRCGKDVLVDKPGVTSAEDLASLRQVVDETGRIWSVALGRLLSRSVQAALKVAQSGEIGRPVHLTQLAPHRLNRALRPGWFFDKAAYGGIIADIGTHSVDQFAAFAGTTDITIDMATIGTFGTQPDGFEDFAEFVMSSASLRGYARVDWFTPDGLASWGDGRVFLIGTEGTLELRKNLDVAGRAGGNHMFVVNREATRHVDCSDEPVTYFGDFLMDVRDRTQRAMAQQDVFAVCGLTLRLQADASRFTALRPV
jgi:predicted dehydrogenase